MALNLIMADELMLIMEKAFRDYTVFFEFIMGGDQIGYLE
jgi:hypothetical protein